MFCPRTFDNEYFRWAEAFGLWRVEPICQPGGSEVACSLGSPRNRPDHTHSNSAQSPKPRAQIAPPEPRSPSAEPQAQSPEHKAQRHSGSVSSVSQSLEFQYLQSLTYTLQNPYTNSPATDPPAIGFHITDSFIKCNADEYGPAECAKRLNNLARCYNAFL